MSMRGVVGAAQWSVLVPIDQASGGLYTGDAFYNQRYTITGYEQHEARKTPAEPVDIAGFA